jgi:putative Holliday junction resolvase
MRFTLKEGVSVLDIGIVGTTDAFEFLRMAQEDSGRVLIFEAMPQTIGTRAAAPTVINATPALRRALCPMLSATRNPHQDRWQPARNPRCRRPGRFSPNLSKESCDMSIEAMRGLWDFQPQMKKALGIDLGDARVGVALSDDLGMLAHPLETIPVQSTNVLKRILSIAAERAVTTIVVGMPKNMNGTLGPAAEKAKAFIEDLRRETTIPVVSWDERLSTVSAQRALQEAGRKAKEQRAVIDQVAAQIILQSWLDASV